LIDWSIDLSFFLQSLELAALHFRCTRALHAVYWCDITCFVQEVKEFLGDHKAKNILISKKFKHGVVFFAGCEKNL